MLTIIACIKFVRSELLLRNQQMPNTYILNPYDLYMLEQLLLLKKASSCRIIGVTMGPQGCLESTQRYIAMGLDDIYLVSDPCFAGSDTYSTSYILYKALEYIGKADIYAFGEKSIDGETSQVPIGVSSHLDLLCYTGIEKIENCSDKFAKINRLFVDKIEVIELPYPFTICFHGFTTREPAISLLQLKKARGQMPIILNSDSLQIDKMYCGQNGSKTIVTQTSNIVDKRNAEVIEGSYQNKADILNDVLSKRGIYT